MSVGQALDTRTRLLRAAAHLFARKGIDGVRNHEIHALAGQRNESAIHYHFGSRWKIVEAVLQENEREALALLPPLEQVSSPKAIVEFLVQRLAMGLDTPHGRDWLRIVSELMTRFPYEDGNLGDTASQQLALVVDRLSRLMPSVPEALVERRATAMVRFMTTQMADRARAIDDDRAGGLDDAEFLEELCAMSLGILQPPRA